MIINNELRQFFEKKHPLQDLDFGQIRGSFFKRNQDGTLPNGLYEISDDCDFAKGITENGKQWSFNTSSNTVELVGIEISDSEACQIEYEWAKDEILSVTEQLEKHADNSSRAIATVQEWRDYREELRNYATVDDNGVYSLRTEKPIRPQ